jgi:transposase
VRSNLTLRRIKPLADAVLKDLSPTFEKMYSSAGRPSIPPERMLKASLLMGFTRCAASGCFASNWTTTCCSAGFLDMGPHEASFDHSSFSPDRSRLLKHDVAPEFFAKIVEHAQDLGLMSDDHFTVGGTLIEAGASLKSFKPNEESSDNPPDDPGNPTVNFHGERRSNATHESTTDPEARLARKGAGKEAKLCYSGNALMENRNGLLIDFQIVEANGTAERRTAIEMLDQNLPGTSRITLGADKAYDSANFVATCRALKVTPHAAANDRRRGGSAVDRRTLRHSATSSASKSATISLFAALEVASGKVRGRCFQRHTHLEFIAFLDSLARRYPKRVLHLICDNYGTHKHPAVPHWLAAHPRFHLHFTPTSASWLNLVERWFALITGQAIRRGSFDSVRRSSALSYAGSHTGTTTLSLSAGPSLLPTSNAQSPMLLPFTRHHTSCVPVGGAGARK